MDKKFAVYVAATAICAVSAMTQPAYAVSGSFGSVQTPSLETLTPATSDYVQSQFTFQRSANVAMNWDLGGNSGSAGIATATNTSKGNRSFGGAVGSINTPPKACQNTGTVPLTVAPAAATSVTTCTW